MNNRVLGNSHRVIVAVLLAAVTGGAAEPGFCHEGATGIVKERMQSMETMGDATKRLAKALKLDDGVDVELVSTTAKILVEHGSNIEALFPDTPESRGSAVSESLPEVWTEREQFLKYVEEMLESARAIERIAIEPIDEPELKRLFKRTAQSCKACHRDFRKD